MKVVFLTPWYPTKDNRYGGVFVREYARAVQLHHDVIVLHCDNADPTIHDWWAATRQSDEDLSDGVVSYHVAFKPSRIRLWSFIRYLGSVYRTVNKVSRQHGRPDIVHAHVFTTGWAALLIGRLRHIPVVISEHWTAFPRGILSRTQIFQARFIFRMSDSVLPVSHALQRSLKGHGIRATWNIIPNVVDTDLFRFDPNVPSSEGALRLLAVSSLVRIKGLDILFRALAQVAWQGHPWHLDVVGDGPEATSYDRIVREFGLAANVTFHGQLLKREVAQMMLKADLFVLPSLVETFSVAAAEALASGLPVVVTRCGGPEEFVTERSGTVVAPGDATALADALTNTIRRLPTFDRSMIAQEAQEQFSRRRVGGLLDELYTKLVGRR